MTTYRAGKFVYPRARLMRWLCYGCFALVAFKVAFLVVFPEREETLNHIANRQYHDDLDLTPYRGTIYDRRAFPLAISVRRPSLAVNPRVFNPTAAQIRLLAKKLQMPSKKIKKIAAKTNYFAWLKRKVPSAIANPILKLRIDGLYQISEPFRYYPLGEKFAHLIGYVGIDNTGLLGLEQRFERQLHGEKTALTLIKDAHNQPVFFLPDHAIPEKGGAILHLTLDRVIQEISMEELAIGVREADARNGFVIVADPHTGKILALANYPSFNPNKPRFIDTAHTKNTAVSTLFEPGSIIKPLVVATAINLGLTAADDLHFCENGVLEAGNTVIRDDHPHATLTTEDVIAYSSNICIYKIAQLLGTNRLYHALRNFGLGNTDLNTLPLPGQTPGRITHYQKWSPIRFSNISFGQGLLTSGIELTTAFNSIANGGKLLKPYIVNRLTTDEGETITEFSPQLVSQVLRPETAKTMRHILGRVVTIGTGKRAATNDYTTAGKTSTAEIFDRSLNRYSPNRRIAGFIGFAPRADPHVTIYVSLFEPQNKPYYGGRWAAPVFAKIATRVLHYLNAKKELVHLAK